MQVLKKMLIGMGVIFTGLVALVAGLLWLQSDFKTEHESFVRSFMLEYSQSWDIVDVREQVSNEMLLQVQSPAGSDAVAVFQRLGAVRDITDVRIENYRATTSGSSGVFSFKAEFENAPAIVTLELRVEDGQPRVNGLHINPLSEPPLTGGQADI